MNFLDRALNQCSCSMSGVTSGVTTLIPNSETLFITIYANATNYACANLSVIHF